MNKQDSQAIIKPFLDEALRLKAWPTKANKRRAVLLYLASKLDADIVYTEKELCAVLDEWHTFGDVCLLRRELCDSKLVDRKSDGSAYWRTPEIPS